MNRTFLYAMLISTLLLAVPSQSRAQEVALKTNLLYAGWTQTPNLGIELGLNARTTLELSGGYNPWNLAGTAADNKKLVHWLAQVEYRHWFCRKFNGHFVGIHALGSQYNLAGHKLPLLLGKDSENFRHQGWGVGVGIAYGYQWMLARHWNIEASLGLGYGYLKYDRYNCPKCGSKESTNNSRHYLGPTKAALSIIYVF